MRLFWRHGYETTSIADLTAAMGITAPSIYTAFGDKRRLFLEAMHRYAGDQAAFQQTLDAAPTARDAVRDMLANTAIAFTGKTTPRGCLLASATATGSRAAADVRDAIAKIRRGIATRVARRIRRDIAAGLLPATTSATALADLTIAVVQGMSVLARDNLPRARLQALADHAMAAWP